MKNSPVTSPKRSAVKKANSEAARMSAGQNRKKNRYPFLSLHAPNSTEPTMMPTRLVAATSPCCREVSPGCRKIWIIGSMTPTSVASPAPVICPSEATISTLKWPQRRGIVSMFIFLSVAMFACSCGSSHRFHRSSTHSSATPTPTPTTDSVKRSRQFTAGETWGVICETSRMMSSVMVAMRLFW